MRYCSCTSLLSDPMGFRASESVRIPNSRLSVVMTAESTSWHFQSRWQWGKQRRQLQLPNGSDDDEVVAIVVSGSKKFNVKLIFGGLRGVIWCNSLERRCMFFRGWYWRYNEGPKVALILRDCRWRGSSLRRRMYDQTVCFEWGEEFNSFCNLSTYKDNVFHR